MEVLLVGLSQMMSTVIASGSAVVDFFLDSVRWSHLKRRWILCAGFILPFQIVYFTFLVFLLSSSDDEYKPMKMIRELVPSGRAVAVRITEEMEQAVKYANTCYYHNKIKHVYVYFLCYAAEYFWPHRKWLCFTACLRGSLTHCLLLILYLFRRVTFDWSHYFILCFQFI